MINVSVRRRLSSWTPRVNSSNDNESFPPSGETGSLVCGVMNPPVRSSSIYESISVKVFATDIRNLVVLRVVLLREVANVLSDASHKVEIMDRSVLTPARGGGGARAGESVKEL